MTSRRAFLGLGAAGTAVGLAAMPPVAFAQATGSAVHRVAVLTPGTRVWEPFAQALRELGYVEGRNLVLDFRHGSYDFHQLRKLAQELMADKPDVIVAESTPAALAAKAATTTTPIVIVNVSDPLGVGLVESLARPGGNITGLTDHGVEISTKSVQLLREIVPRARRLGVLMADNPLHATQLREIEATATVAGLSVEPVKAPREADLESAFSFLATRGVDALIVLAGVHDGSTERNARLTGLAAKANMPAIYELQYMPAVGGLMSFGPDIPDSRRVAAAYVARILRGARTSDLPVQRPARFRLVINARTARALGLSIPQALLIQAAEVIE
jgi:putative tryptophan/tyrosine transport system substrate-binding protein